jgi:phenylacetate-CoA ligase
MNLTARYINEHFHTLMALPRNTKAARERIVAFQSRKLKSVVQHAYENVPYYRELFNLAGLKPVDIRAIDDLSLIPVTSSKDYRKHPVQRTLTRGMRLKSLFCHSTSGSTSRPFNIFRTSLEEHLINMFRIRAMSQLGVKVSDRLGRLKILGLSGNKGKLLRSLRQGLHIYREHLIDCFQPREKILEELHRFVPDVVLGYPSFITHVAPFPSENEFRNIRPRMVITGGESLTPFSRKRLKEGFNAEVYDTYGANEFNLVAWQCRESDFYHVCDDNIILEVLNNGKSALPGERGEVVATSLHAYAMPFIRYSLGDIATKGPETCPCGQPFSTLASIQGRVHDYFLLPDGPMHPNEISIPIVMNAGSWIDRYKIIQEKEDRIKFCIKPLKDVKEEDLDFVSKLARERLGDRVDFCVEIVNELPFDPGGKFRVSRSRVKSHLDGIDWSRI